jgi:hypothetical protein
VGTSATGGAGSAGASAADRYERGSDFDRLILGYQDGLDDSRDGRGDLGVDLVGRDFEQRLVDLDPVADVLEPTGDRALGDTLAECREVDGFAHQ